MEESGALQDALALGFHVYGQQDLQVIGITKVRMVTVCALYDVQFLSCNTDRFSNGECTAVKGAI